MDALLIFTLLWFGVGFVIVCAEYFKAWKRGVDFTVWNAITIPFWSAFGFILLLEYVDLLGPFLTKLINFKLIKGRHK